MLRCKYRLGSPTKLSRYTYIKRTVCVSLIRRCGGGTYPGVLVYLGILLPFKKKEREAKVLRAREASLCGNELRTKISTTARRGRDIRRGPVFSQKL